MPKREFVGRVKGNKMTKTVVVEVEELRTHPVYLKKIKRRKKYKVHNDLGAKLGDMVKIQETRPVSRHKRFRVIEIVESKQQ